MVHKHVCGSVMSHLNLTMEAAADDLLQEWLQFNVLFRREYRFQRHLEVRWD